MDSQYHWVNGGWPVTQNVYSGEKAPGFCEQNMSYGMNIPYGTHAAYGENSPYRTSQTYAQNPPYGQNAPYGVNAPNGTNPSYEQTPPYGVNAPNGTNPPYGQNAPYGVNAPYGTNPSYEQNQPYGVNAPNGINPSYGMNTPNGINPPYGINPSYEQNQPYGVNPPYGTNQPYGMNAPYGINPLYSQNVSYGMNLPYRQNPAYEIAPSYGRNLPCAVNPPFGGAGLPAVYTAGQQGTIEPYRGRYQLAPNNPKNPVGGSKEGRNQLLLFSIAGVIIAAFLAIMIGITINDDGTGMNISEAFDSWMEGFSSGNKDEERLPAVSFPTQSSGTIRGDLFAVGEDGSVFLRTEYGICRVAKNGSDYEYNGWAAELDPDVEVRSMAVYGDYLYLACGENGIYRVNTARSNTLSQIIDDNVTSFVIAEDNLFYLSMEYPDTIVLNETYGFYGNLCIAGLNGKGSRPLGERVRRATKYLSSADFVYVDGYLYFLDEETNIKRIRTDGTGSRVVVERERQKPSFLSCGLYENGGVLYLPSWGGGIYSYDIEADQLKVVSDAYITERSPILFVGNALLYKEKWDGVWHQIKDGQDLVFESMPNDTRLWMQAVGENDLITFYEPQGDYTVQSPYHTVSFVNGEIRREAPVSVDYTVMPEVDIEEEQDMLLLQGTVQENCRSAHFAFDGPNESSVYDHYTIYLIDADVVEQYGYRSSFDGVECGLIWTYTDETGEHTERLVEGKVGTFLVQNDDLYYTLWDEGTESYAFFYKCLDDHEEDAEGCLIASGMDKKFACCNGMIYYVDADDGRMYRYILWSGETERLGDEKVGCYDIYNGMIYYENLSDSSRLYRMRLDGTEAERIDTPLHAGAALCQLTVCPYLGSVYLAVTLEEDQNEDGCAMCVFAEDGSTEIFFGEDVVGQFDRKQTLYYRDGRLYYSSRIAYEVRVFDFEEHLEGGSGIRAGAYDTVFCLENMNTFAVTEEFVYVQEYTDCGIFIVYDRQTGEVVKNISCLNFRNL